MNFYKLLLFSLLLLLQVREKENFLKSNTFAIPTIMRNACKQENPLRAFAVSKSY